MKASEIKCQKCGQGLMAAANRGAYLQRVNPKGETPAINQCAPSCEHKDSDQNAGLLGAITNT